jgi:short-subunit dehydrogenase
MSRAGWNLELPMGLLFGLGLLMAARAARRRRIDLNGKRAWVNGGSRGLGLLLARELAAHGCRVAISARDAQELQAARGRLQEWGADVLTLPCDASDPEAVARTLDRLTEEFEGAPEILVNCASIIQVGPLESMRASDFEQALAHNFYTAIYPILAVLPAMRNRRQGHIVNVTSIGGRVAVPHLLPYVCAKFAVVGLTEGLQAELRKDRVHVLNVIPGLMRTGSPVNAWFKGDAAGEWTWFSLGDSLPLLSIDAQRAARRIVSAIQHEENRVVLGWPAAILGRAHDLAPQLTVQLMGLINALLPSGTGGSALRGMELASRLSPSTLTKMMNVAARFLNQYSSPAHPSAEPARRTQPA